MVLRARMALHTGTADSQAPGYVGPSLNRAIQLLAAGHGGQILLSLATEELVRDDLPPEVELRDLGEYRLKDLIRAERVYQIVAPDLPSDFPSLRTLDSYPTNLPIQLTSLVGREREVTDVAALVRSPEVRLLTLTGPGGTGKTRLALQVAAEVLENFEHGVYFVALAAVSDSGLVLPTIAQALGVADLGDRSPLARLLDYLREKEMLLLLDNYEQVLDAAPLLAELIAAAPRLKVFITSRAVLHVYGEQEYPVPPLSLPDPKRLPRLESLSQYEAVALFIQRARAVRSEFEVTSANAPAVAEICAQLDGLPLAIELAAARSKLLSPQAMLGRLQSRLGLLTGGPRDLPTRQRTLRGAIDWSYALLDPAEQRLFLRLAVFVGGFTLSAAEAVCAHLDDMDVLEGLTSLVDKSMLRQVGADEAGEPRFLMLQTLREYAHELLVTSGDGETMRRRHAEYYLAQAEQAEQELLSPRQADWLKRLETEHDNVRAALRWCIDSRQAEQAMRLGGALWRFWYVRGYLYEGRRWLSEVLALPCAPAQSEARAAALNGAGNLAYNQGDYSTAKTLHEESLRIRRELGDSRAAAGSLNNLALIARRHGDYAVARALLDEALELNRALGNRSWEAINLNNLGSILTEQGDHAAARELQEASLSIFRELGNEWGEAMALCDLGQVAYNRGDIAASRVLYEESVALQESVGDRRVMAIALTGLGNIACRLGDHKAARAHLAEAMAISREIGDTWCTVRALEGFANLAVAQGEPERSLRLDMAAGALRSRIVAPLSANERRALERRSEITRQALTSLEFDRVFGEKVLALDEAVGYAHDERGG